MCECSIKKSNWGKHLRTTKHGIACGDIVVEEVEKKQCWKCRGQSCWKCLGGRMLRVIDAWGIGQNGQVITLKK